MPAQAAEQAAEFLRGALEPPQYGAFFSAFILLGILEQFFARRSAGPGRRRRTATAINILVLSALPVSVLAMADYAAANGRGLLNRPAAPSWLAFVAGLMVRSFAAYLIHPANHKVPSLSRIQRLYGRPPDELATMRLGLEECQDARTTSLPPLSVLSFIPLAPLKGARHEGGAAASARGAGAG